MFNNIKKHLAFALSVLSVVSGAAIELEPECGITVRDVKEPFTIFNDGSVATDIVEETDGSISWVATAAGGAGGGVAFYVKPTKEEINIANYESVDIEMDYTAVESKWAEDAKTPSFVLRVLPWDSTGLFGGFEDVEYFDSEEMSGTMKYNVKIPENFSEQVIASSDYDSILAFAIKFNDYQRGNADGDQLKVTLKNVKFNAKEGAPEDVAFSDGLEDSQRGSVIEIYYPTRDYTVDETDLTEADKYEKHAWVYLPAGYDEKDTETKYPVFILLHGSVQNENTWGLTNKGRGGKIKGFMDRGMATGEVEKFILVCATGVSSKNWGPNGIGDDYPAYEVFGSEFRADLLPYLRANFNIKDGRDNVAIAGLSRGGGQTMNIGVGQLLDLISHFGTFSAPVTNVPEFEAAVDAKPEFDGLKIHTLYAICGTADFLYGSYPSFIEEIPKWDRIEVFQEYTYPGGTHDFPVWYKGFNDFIHLIFKEDQYGKVEPVEQPTTPKYGCWAEVLGYPCCAPGNTHVYDTDVNGDWGYDFENFEWCGLTPYEEPADEQCWSEELGYPCCKDCTVYLTDKKGKWGYDFLENTWCGIQSFCEA